MKHWFMSLFCFHYSIELGRFQNLSVSVLNFKQHSVPVLIGSVWKWTFGSGSRQFGSSVLLVLIFWSKKSQSVCKIEHFLTYYQVFCAEVLKMYSFNRFYLIFIWFLREINQSMLKSLVFGEFQLVCFIEIHRKLHYFMENGRFG